MTKDPKTPNIGAGNAGEITRREFTNRAAALGVTTALVTGIGGATGFLPSDAKAAMTPKRGGHLRLGMSQANTTDSLDPQMMPARFVAITRNALRNALVEVDHTGNLMPELAESWEPGDSPLTWIFNLRNDVTFRDGKTVDADDVITTIRYHGGEGSKSGYRSMVKAIDDMEADGKNRVIVHLKEPNAHFPALASAFEILSTKDGVPYDFANGTGPYSLKDFEPGVRATLERHPSHWREGVGWFDAVTVLAILDVAARQNALVTGEVDVISEPDRKTWQLLNRRDGIKVDRINSSVHRTWPMHADKAPFDNNDVRLALKYAVDREKLVKTVLNGTGSVGNDHPISPVNKFFNKELPQRVYDPDKAKFHLKKAGMENLTVKLSSSETIWDGAIDAASLYSESAAKAGIKIEINRVPSDGYWSDVWLKHPWSASLWSGRPTEDWMFTEAYAADAPWNETMWQNARFNELLKAARAELDENKARDMYWEMQQIVRDDGGAVIPIFADHLIAYSEKLAHGPIAGNWDLDGRHLLERWWFA